MALVIDLFEDLLETRDTGVEALEGVEFMFYEIMDRPLIREMSLSQSFGLRCRFIKGCSTPYSGRNRIERSSSPYFLIVSSFLLTPSLTTKLARYNGE
jgi:hypothetical protein